MTFLTSGTIFGASLRVTTQFIGHNVQMTGIGFVTLAEILKYLNINMLRKSVIGRNEAPSPRIGVNFVCIHVDNQIFAIVEDHMILFWGK